MFHLSRLLHSVCFAVLAAIVALALPCPLAAQGAAPQTIEFLPISDRPVTSAPFYVVAVASSNLPLTLTVQGPATLDARALLTLTAPGTVTLTASQPGNSQYAPATAQLTFTAQPGAPVLAWQQPASIVYGTPVTAAMLNATAATIPLADPPADTPTITAQPDTSVLAPGAAIPYPQTSPVFRYEGSTMAPGTSVDDHGGYVPTGSRAPLGLTYRVAFTCACSQFEYVVQARGGKHRLWVNGHYTALDALQVPSDFPHAGFFRVQFPDKRLRQIKLSIGSAAPFYGVITTSGDTLSAPQVPVGDRVILFGDSWTGPTILQSALPPDQQGLAGSGFSEFLGQIFNWDYWTSGVGGQGFTASGYDLNGAFFPQRVLTDICPFAPARVFMLGGVNDGGAAPSTLQAAVTSTFTSLQSCLPGVPIDFYGPQEVNSITEPVFAAATAPFVSVRYDDIAPRGWLYGDPLSAATGNVYLYFNGHPTPLGHRFLADKFAMDLIAAHPSLAPAPYPLFTAIPAAGTFTYSAPPGTLLPVGNNAITATFAPADTANYADATLQIVLSITRASTTLGITTNSSTVAVRVQPQIAGLPSGTLTVSDNGSAVSSIPLNNGTAIFDTSSLSSGSHSLAFAYPGDANFTGSAATTVVSLIRSNPPDFTVTATPSQLSLAPGAQGTVALAVTPTGGLEASLSLGCLGLPVGATCSLRGGSTLSLDGVPTTASVLLQLPAGQTAALAGQASPAHPHRSAADGTPAGHNPQRGAVAFSSLAASLLLLCRNSRRLRTRLAELAIPAALCACFAAAASMLSGCGGASPAASPVPRSATYTIQLQLTNAAIPSMARTTTVNLTVPAQ